MQGLGILSSVGYALEDPNAYGVPVAPTDYWPVISESISAPRESIDSGQLVGQREIGVTSLGIKQLSGGFSLETDGVSNGQALKLWNGSAGYSVASLNTMLIDTTPPTVTAGAGGSLAAGTYRYLICPTALRAVDGLTILLPPTPEATGTTTGSNLTLSVAYAAISSLTPPLGFAISGAAIFRSPLGGGTGTCTYLDWQAIGSGTTYADGDQSTHRDANVTAPAITNLYRHRYLGTPPASGVEPLSSFSVTVNKDNDVAECYAGCRMNEFKIGAASANAPILSNFTLMGQNVTPVTNTNPTFTQLEQMLGWKAACFLDSDVGATTIEAFDINCTNNCAAVPGFKATPYNRDVASGFRKISGSIKRNNDDHKFWNKVQNGTEFSLKFNFYGQGIVSAGSNLQLMAHGVEAIPFPFFMEIELFRLRTPKVDNPVTGPGRIIETVDFGAFRSPAYQTAMRINLYNTTPTY